MTQAVVGFLGLGLMGKGFTARLRSQGLDVVGFDVSSERLAEAQSSGIELAGSPADVVRRADIVCCSVTTPANVEDIVAGPNGLIAAGSQPGKVFVDHSTTPIDLTLRLGADLASATGMAFVDAPVSGGPTAAEAGTLAIMAGGTDQAIATIEPVMQTLGRFTHMGELGAGQATKLINQTLVLTNYCVMAEALRVAEAYGVDASKVPHALETGHAGSNLLPVLFERMIARDWTPHGYARQVLKDLEMLNDAAHEQGLAMPMSAQALTLFRMLVGQGKGELDGSAVLELLPDAKSK